MRSLPLTCTNLSSQLQDLLHGAHAPQSSRLLVLQTGEVGAEHTLLTWEATLCVSMQLGMVECMIDLQFSD